MDYTNLKERMEKSIGAFKEKLSEIRAGRANPAILNKVKIDYYGTPTPINQVAGVSVPEARLIVIQPWDVSVLKDIEKAILASDIGLNPNNDGKVIRLAFPELTEERRKELAFERDYWFDLGRLPRAKAKAIISAQNRGNMWIVESFTPDDSDFILPYPANDVAKNPKVLEAPVPYTFK